MTRLTTNLLAAGLIVTLTASAAQAQFIQGRSPNFGGGPPSSMQMRNQNAGMQRSFSNQSRPQQYGQRGNASFAYASPQPCQDGQCFGGQCCAQCDAGQCCGRCYAGQCRGGQCCAQCDAGECCGRCYGGQCRDGQCNDGQCYGRPSAPPYAEYQQPADAYQSPMYQEAEFEPGSEAPGFERPYEEPTFEGADEQNYQPQFGQQRAMQRPAFQQPRDGMPQPGFQPQRGGFQQPAFQSQRGPNQASFVQKYAQPRGQSFAQPMPSNYGARRAPQGNPYAAARPMGMTGPAPMFAR